MSLDRRSLGYLLAFGSAAAGAVRYNLAVYAEPHGFSYVPFLAYALAVGVACSAVHVTVRDGFKGFVPLRGRWVGALAYGVLMAWSSLSNFIALEYLNETVVTSLSQVSILVTISLAVWLLGERFTRAEWLATIVIVAGMVILNPWEAARSKGVLIVLTGLLSGSFATVGAKRWVQGTPPRVLMLWRNAVALLVVGSYTLAFYDRPRVTVATAIACLATGICGPYLHGLFFLQALERIDAAKAALMNRVQPAIVFLLSWLVLSRLPSTDEMWSALVLIAGTFWLAAARTRA